MGTQKDVVQAAGWELEPRGGSLGGAQRAGWVGAKTVSIWPVRNTIRPHSGIGGQFAAYPQAA